MAVTEAAYDKLEDYDSRYVGPRWDLWDHVTLETAAPFLPPAGGHILDAGAGTGKFALKFLQRGHRVTLLDPSAAMLETARAKIEAGLGPEARGRASYVVGTIERLEFPDGHFDFVFSDGDPLSYCIQTHRQAAAELVRVLKPGHGFYASCDNRWHAVLLLLAMGKVQEALRCAREGPSRDPYGNPVHAFEPWELQEVFEQAGARDVQVTGKLALAHFFADQPLASLLQGESGRELYRIEAELGRRPALAGMASHLQVTGRKPEAA